MKTDKLARNAVVIEKRETEPAHDGPVIEYGKQCKGRDQSDIREFMFYERLAAHRQPVIDARAERALCVQPRKHRKERKHREQRNI